VEQFGISNGLNEPSAEESKNYLKVQHAWSNKIDTAEASGDLPANIQRKEVFDGYSTAVEDGRHKKYEGKTPFALFHEVRRAHQLPAIMQGGLLSTHERLKRGITTEGLSSKSDMLGGGGDSVFTRMITKEGADKAPNKLWTRYAPTLILSPDLVDRTDWYAYNQDHSGATDSYLMDKRQTMDDILSQQAQEGFQPDNEMMFRTGIPPEKILGVACEDEEARSQILAEFQKAGMKEVNGMPVEQFVVITKDRSGYFDIVKNNRKDLQHA